MSSQVILCLKGTQTYPDQEPETIELLTEGVLEQLPNGWMLSYEESALTGLEGVHTAFVIEKDTITLNRTGKLTSQMVFSKGKVHDSLYQMEFGTFMISVCATEISASLSEQGGTVDLVYRIEIEHGDAGIIAYHLEIKPKNK